MQPMSSENSASNVVFRCLVKVPRHSAKKNEKEPRFNPRTRKLFLGKTERAVICENWLKQMLTIQKLKNRIDTPIDFYINAKFTFFIPRTQYFNKNGTRSKKIIDTSNAYQLPEDVMQKVGILENDTFIDGHDGSRRKPIDGTEYFLEIELTRLSE